MNNLVSLLEEVDFSTMDTATTSKSIDAVVTFLKKAEAHLVNIVDSSPPSSPTATSHSGGLAILSTGTDSKTVPPISTCVNFLENFLEPDVLEELKNELNRTKFTATPGRKNYPEISLHGEWHYVFNMVSESVDPSPIKSGSIWDKVLDIVNAALGTNYNSILGNKYRTKNVSLGWHKDGEKMVDNSVPISALSIGATRRFMISDSKVKSSRTQMFEQELSDNSLFTMLPGLQSTHFHRVAEGRSSKQKECGMRHSLTFRRLLPNGLSSTSSQMSSPQQQAAPCNLPSPSMTPSTPTAHANCANTLVFGSSLTAGLDSNLLSKRGKTFKVFTRGGAHVETVAKMITEAIEKGELCTSCVQSIFIVAGGNDVENIISNSGINKLQSSFKKLIDMISTKLPTIRINIISLMPRRCYSYMHLQRIFCINDFLERLCKSYDKCYFIKMFSKFLLYKGLYYSNSEVYLNERLYKVDRLHFSAIGNSVLAKTLIGVANNPYT